MNSSPKYIDPSNVNADKLKAEAMGIINSVKNWSPNKRFDQNISFGSLKQRQPEQELITTNTFTSNVNDDFWVGRITVLPETLTSAFKDKFDKYLIGPLPIDPNNNHTSHEKNYIHDLYDYQLKPIDDNSYLVKTFYKLPFPLSKRVFYDYIYIVKEEKEDDQSSALVISISIDPKNFEESSNSSQYTVGNYTSIEKVSVKDGKLQWEMCTSSNPNGSIPNWVTRLSLPGAIVNDVPSFLKYCDNH